MKTGTLLFVLAASSLPFVAYAGSDLSKLSKMKNPGEWETKATVTMKITGMPAAMQKPRTTTVSKCLSKDDMDKMSDFTPKSANGMTCTMVKKDLTGNTFSYTMKCTGKEGNLMMNGSTVFDSKDASHTHVEMNGKMDSMPMQMTMDATSRRTGACTSKPQKGG